MKKIAFTLVTLMGVAALGHQGGDTGNLGIFAETKLTRIPGMKIRSVPKIPFGLKLPGNIAQNLPGTPHRGLSVRLWSPNPAPDNATASLAIPSGLELGDKLDLEIYRPAPITTGSGGQSDPTGGPSSPPKDFTIKIYWGSSDTVQDGQPKIISLKDLNPEGMQTLSHRMQIARQGDSGSIYKPTGSTAYWPGKGTSPQIKDDASLSGTFTLTSSYAGSSTIDAGSGVDFLAPIEITSPDLDQKVSLDASLPFQWNPIPNCLGQIATGFGFEKDTNTMILWVSSANYGDRVTGDMGYMQMQEVKDAVANNTFLPGSATSVTVPAGIFKACGFAMFNLVGYGPGSANSGASPIARIQTKTDVTVMLGGMGGRGRPTAAPTSDNRK